MNCKEAHKYLLSFLDGELQSDQQFAIEQHLGSCKSCQEALKMLQGIYAGIDEEVKAFEPNPYLSSKVWSRIHSKQESINVPVIPLRRAHIITITAAGIAFGIAIGTLFNSSSTSDVNSSSEQNWTQLADDYFPSDVFSPYEEIIDND